MSNQPTSSRSERGTLGDDSTRRSVLGAIAGGLGTALLGTASARAAGRGRASDGDSYPPVAAARIQDESPYAEVYQETIDSVALVRIGPDGDDRPGGLGTGFVANGGYLITNAHVVGAADAAEVQFGDTDWRSATLQGLDRHSDLAVLGIDDRPEYARPLSLEPESPSIGTEVVAFGNPFGLDASISSGIVSGVNRLLPSPSGAAVPGAIQTDASVNPGNSGGPLVDLDGDVRGVVFAGIGQTLGFAISTRLARRVVPDLVERGTYDHPYLGVQLVPVSPTVAEANDLDEPGGVLVTQVVPDSPADGVLQPARKWAAVDGVPVPAGGDVIVDLDGEPIPNRQLLAATIALETSPGDSLALGILRDGERQTVTIELGVRPTEVLPDDSPTEPPGADADPDGATITHATDGDQPLDVEDRVY